MRFYVYRPVYVCPFASIYFPATVVAVYGLIASCTLHGFIHYKFQIESLLATPTTANNK